MTRFSSSSLPEPPKEYDRTFFIKLLRQLQNALDRLSAPGPIRCASDKSQSQSAYPISGLTIIDVPTSATGLSSGMVWSDGGTLKIVP